MRILWPKEHGAYGQLLFPLGTALALGPRAAAFALAAACVAVFVAHEAVLTLLGHRGGRAAREGRGDAIVSLASCGVLASIAGGWAVAHMAPQARLSVLLPVALGAVLALFIAAAREHSTAGEVCAGIAMSSCVVPVALAGGVPAARALVCWLVFGLSFTVATLAVRATIARVKVRRASPAVTVGSGFSRILTTATTASAWPGPAVVAVSLVAADRGWVPFAVPLALMPVCGLAVGLSLFAPHPRHLRAVGWSLVAATGVTAIVLAVAA